MRKSVSVLLVLAGVAPLAMGQFVPSPENGSSSAGTVLMFVSQQNTYYSEYIVMRAALEAAGYTVDLRSAVAGTAGIYMVPAGTDIEETANTLGGSSYSQFTSQFQNLFGSAWNAALNPTPSSATVDGSIVDVDSMAPYVALVVVGGTGVIDYRVDGSYAAQGSVTAFQVQQAAEKLNALAIEALIAGKPVMGQCHGASLPPYWRVPGTMGAGAESIGYSILKGQVATGYPEAATGTSLTSLDIEHRSNDRVTVASPHSSLDDGGRGDYRIITTRDWYPQSVAHAARTLIDMLQTYPSGSVIGETVNVVILHGGAVDSGNCSASNHANDVPCNYGSETENLPADYTNLVALLTGDSPNDTFSFNVTELNLTGTLPFDANDQGAIETWLSSYDVVVFFKHWSTGITDALQNALVAYADDGGGVLGLHHAIYNQPENGLDKDILTAELFGVESASGTFSAQRLTYRLFNTGYGHFITTYGIPLTSSNPALTAPTPWGAQPLPAAANASYSTYQNFQIYDEIYGNTAFEAGVSFGRGVGQLTPLFSNNQTPAGQVHTAGFARRFNPSADATIGKVAYFQAGERPESFALDHAYGQVVRNAVRWLADGPFVSTTAPTGVTATAETTTSVAVTWTAVAGATSYNVYRSASAVAGYSFVATVTETSFTDDTASAMTAYLYRVRAASGTTESPDSSPDLATTIIFTDPTLTAGVTTAKDEHLTELRSAVGAVRALAGLSSASFTDPSLASGYTVKRLHITELRSALDEARSTLGVPAVAYTDPTITVGSTMIKALHVTDLRSGVE